jgi:hypothetical protein
MAGWNALAWGYAHLLLQVLLWRRLLQGWGLPLWLQQRVHGCCWCSWCERVSAAGAREDSTWTAAACGALLLTVSAPPAAHSW